MINANDNGNTVIVANAIELIAASIIKINGGEKKLRNLDVSKQRIADTVAARINSRITLTIGSKTYHA